MDRDIQGERELRVRPGKGGGRGRKKVVGGPSVWSMIHPLSFWEQLLNLTPGLLRGILGAHGGP